MIFSKAGARSADSLNPQAQDGSPDDGDGNEDDEDACGNERDRALSLHNPAARYAIRDRYLR